MANPGVVQELSARAKMMSNLRNQFREQGNRDSDTTEMLEKLLGTLGDLKPSSSPRSQSSQNKANSVEKIVDAVEGATSEFENFKRTADRLHSMETRENEVWNKQQEKTLHKEFDDLRDALKAMHGSGDSHMPHTKLPHLRRGKRGTPSPHERERARAHAEEEHRNAKAAEEEHSRQSKQAEKEENARRKQAEKQRSASKRTAELEAKDAEKAEAAAQKEAAKKIQYAKSANEADDLRKAEEARKSASAAAAAKKSKEAARLASEAKDGEKAARVAADAAKLSRAGKAAELAAKTSTAAKLAKTGVQASKFGARQAMKLIPGIGLVVDAASVGYDLYTAKEHAGESFLGQKKGEGGLLDSRAMRYGDATLAGAGIGAAVGSIVPVVGTAIGAVGGAAIGAGSVALAEADIPGKVKAAKAYAAKEANALHDWVLGKTKTAVLPPAPTATNTGATPPPTASNVTKDVAAMTAGIAVAGGLTSATGGTGGAGAAGSSIGTGALIGSSAVLAGTGAIAANSGNLQPNNGANTATGGNDQKTINFDKLHFDLGDLNSLTMNIAAILGSNGYDAGGLSGAGSGTGGGGYKGGSGEGGASWSPNSVTVPVGPGAKNVANSVTAEAHKQGLDPKLALVTAQIESSMGTAKKNPNSTATGVFQLTDRTWKSVGGTEANRDDIASQVQLGVKSLKSSQDAAAKVLGHDPEAWQTYMLHQQGQAGGSALLKANANANAIQTLAPVYGSEESARKAIINNGGNSDTTAQEFMDSWKKRYNTVAEKVSKAMPDQFAGDNAKATAETNTASANSNSSISPTRITSTTVDNTANVIQRSDILQQTNQEKKVAANPPKKQTTPSKPPSQAPAGMGQMPDLDTIPLALNDQGLGLVLTGSVN